MSMAKKMISRLSVLAVLIVFLAACSKQTEYTNVIPADATAVASIDLKSLAREGDQQSGSIRSGSGSTDLYL